MTPQIFEAPERIVFGNGCAGDVGSEAKGFGTTAMVVTGRSSTTRTGVLERICQSLSAAGVTPVPFPEVEPNPSVTTVEKGAALAREKGCDVIVGLGGGSPLDAAKGIALLLANGGGLADYENGAPFEPGVPVIAVPTTAGTGSEVTRFSVITDTERKIKMLISGQGIIPKVALLDPELTLTMPAGVTAATGMDALTHAIEAFISRKGSPLTDVHCLESIRLVGANLVKAIVDPGNMEAREAMLLGQLHAGLAICNSSTALVHSMSRPLGAYFEIPHGAANAMLLPSVMAYTRPACPEKFALVAEALGERIGGLSLDEASERAIMAVQRIFDRTGLPAKLADYGVTRDSLPKMAEDAAASGTTPPNPRVPSIDEIIAMYSQIME